MSPAIPSCVTVVQPCIVSDNIEDNTQSQEDKKGEKCQATKFKPVPPQSSAQAARQTAYDECTIRKWYMEMDVDANGTVTKDEFINYLRSRPQLQNVMYEGLKPGMSGKQDVSTSGSISRAIGVKRVITVYKDMDQDRNGVVSWEKFIDFFQRTGLLITYVTPNNPRDQMASTLAEKYQESQAVAKWQRALSKIGGMVRPEALKQKFAEPDGAVKGAPKQKIAEPEDVAKDDETKLLAVAAPLCEQSSHPFDLPVLLRVQRPCENRQLKQLLLDSFQTCSKSPMSCKGGKTCNKVQSWETSPKKKRHTSARRRMPSRRRIMVDLAAKYGPTPEHQVLITSDVH